MKKLGFFFFVVGSIVCRVVLADSCESFSAPVSMQADFRELNLTHELKGTYQSDCANFRFDFFAEDEAYPTDVSVIVNVGQKKIFVVSHRSKSYFTQPWNEKKLENIHQLIVPFQNIFSDSNKRKYLGEKKILETWCKEYAFATESGVGKVCLDKSHEDWPLRIEAKLSDGSFLKQKIGPYKKETFSLQTFNLPDGYKKEDYSVAELFDLFLDGEPPLPVIK